METADIGLLLRGFERLIIVLAAALSVWLGYRLFSLVVADRGSFDGKFGEWQIKLQRIAPGVFFALFGAAILAFALNVPFEYKPGTRNDSKGTGAVVGWSYSAGAVPPSEQMRLTNVMTQITVLSRILDKNVREGKFSQEDLDMIRITAPALLSYRDSMVDQAFGPGWKQKYFEIAAKTAKDPTHIQQLSTEDRTNFLAIRSALALN
jgi:hypothetical protein